MITSKKELADMTIASCESRAALIAPYMASAIHGKTTEGTETTRKETAIPCPFRVFPWFVLQRRKTVFFEGGGGFFGKKKAHKRLHRLI
jgi:hypothetical protein